MAKNKQNKTFFLKKGTPGRGCCSSRPRSLHIFCRIRPQALGIFWSFFDMKGFAIKDFVGFDNYRRVVTVRLCSDLSEHLDLCALVACGRFGAPVCDCNCDERADTRTQNSARNHLPAGDNACCGGVDALVLHVLPRRKRTFEYAARKIRT